VDLLGLVHNKLERDQSRKCFCGRVDTVYLPHDDGNASTRNLVSEDVRMVRQTTASFAGEISGNAIQSWTPCNLLECSSGVSSACAMPAPAVIRLSSPGCRKSLRTQAVSVQHLPFKQPRYGLKADVADVALRPSASRQMNSMGPKWSKKHHGPIVRRCPYRQCPVATLRTPTSALREGNASIAGPADEEGIDTLTSGEGIRLLICYPLPWLEGLRHEENSFANHDTARAG